MIQRLRDLTTDAVTKINEQKKLKTDAHQQALDAAYDDFVNCFFPEKLLPAMHEAAARGENTYNLCMNDIRSHGIEYYVIRERILRYLVDKGLVAQWPSTYLSVSWS